MVLSFSTADSDAIIAITIDAALPISSIAFTLVDSNSNPQPFESIIFSDSIPEGLTDSSVPSSGE